MKKNRRCYTRQFVLQLGSQFRGLLRVCDTSYKKRCVTYWPEIKMSHNDSVGVFVVRSRTDFHFSQQLRQKAFKTCSFLVMLH